MDLKPVFKLLEKARKNAVKEASKRIKDDAAYLATMLRRVPERVNAQDPKKQKSGGVNYVQLSHENLVWLPDPNGRKPVADGTTVREFVQSLGKTTERGKNKVRSYTGKYVRPEGGFTPGVKRTWDYKKQLDTYEKGSRRATRKEREYVAKLKAEERKLMRKFKAQDSKKLQKIRRQILKLEQAVSRKKPKRGASAKLTRKQEEFRRKREQLLRERQLKLQRKRKPKHYRILGDMPLEKTFLRMVRPDTVRTWFGDGGPEKYLGRRWTVNKINDLMVEVSIHPLSSDHNFLRNIEYGGTFDPKPVLNGYTVIFEDTGRKGQNWNQRRVRFLPHTEDSSQAHVKPRHFVSQTVERFNKQRQKVN